MHAVYAQFIDRLQDAFNAASSLGRLAAWIEKHTTLGGTKFSLREHEWQRAILDSTHRNVVVTKCSQVGLSEIMSRMAPAFLATNPDTTSIYAYPTLQDAQRFAKSRIDPVIRGSDTLKGMMAPGSDSSMFKQIGTSQLHLVGTRSPIISVATDLIVFDELDFCVAENVTTAESRLTHSRFRDPVTGDRGLMRKFSTPTVPGYGVSDLYDRSNQYVYMVKCRHCSHWFHPQFLHHCVVDGWDKSFEELTYLDVISLEDRGLVSSGRLLCEKCHNVVTVEDLLVDNRQWVAKHPSRTMIEGFSVNPLDSPTYRYVPFLLRKLVSYRGEQAHFRNFELGLPYADASNSILPDVVRENTTLTPIPPEQARALGVTGCIAGLDLGKTSWFVVGRVHNRQVHVLWAEQIRLRSETGNDLETRVLELLDTYGVYRLVSDAEPYTDTVLKLQSARGEGCVLPCKYDLTDRNLQSYRVDEPADKPWSVHAQRTKVLNHLAKRINSGQFRFAKFPEMVTVIKHLQGTKRVDRFDEHGEMESDWVKVGDDHYAHALSYMNIAADMTEKEFECGWAPLPRITEIEVGKNTKPIQKEERYGHIFEGAPPPLKDLLTGRGAQGSR